jgi:hypothetical protein
MDALQVQTAGAGYGGPVPAMMYWLREVARELREERGRKHVHIAASGDLDQSTLSRFESGESKPKDLDATVQAYADDLDMKAPDIWGLALERWRASIVDDRTAVEEESEARARQSEQIAGASAPKKPRQPRIVPKHRKQP